MIYITKKHITSIYLCQGIYMGLGFDALGKLKEKLNILNWTKKLTYKYINIGEERIILYNNPHKLFLV